MVTNFPASLTFLEFGSVMLLQDGNCCNNKLETTNELRLNSGDSQHRVCHHKLVAWPPCLIKNKAVKMGTDSPHRVKLGSNHDSIQANVTCVANCMKLEHHGIAHYILFYFILDDSTSH